MKVSEEAKSKTQQRLFGMALAYSRGDLKIDDLPNDEIKNKVRELSELDEETLEKYASTKHDGLPEKIEEHLSEELELFIENATLSNTLGMGNVVLPSDSNPGSGDIPRSPKSDKEKNALNNLYTYQEFLDKMNK